MSNKYKCGCGYGLNVQFNKNMSECPSKHAFRNHVTFPAIASMPESMHYDRKQSSIYYDENGRDVRNWGGLFQLEKLKARLGYDLNIPNEIWAVTNLYQEQTVVRIHLDYSEREKPTTFSPDEWKVGKTLAALYADKTNQLCTGQLMINFLNYDSCYLFNAPILQVQEETNRLLRSADLEVQLLTQECFECGVSNSNLKSCSSCKLAKYCSRVNLIR